MPGGTVQMGRIQLASFGWPSHFGLVAHHGQTGAARSANGGAGSSGGALGRLGNTAHPTGGSKKGGPRRKDELHGDVRSTGGEQRWGRRPGAMVDGSRCGKVVHGGAVLVVATGSAEGDRGRRYMVAR
jgi:hypothetical protein